MAAEVVTEAVNDTLKAIAACLLMEQVLAPRFEFTRMIAHWDAYGDSAYLDFVAEAQPDTATIALGPEEVAAAETACPSPCPRP